MVALGLCVLVPVTLIGTGQALPFPTAGGIPERCPKLTTPLLHPGATANQGIIGIVSSELSKASLLTAALALCCPAVLCCADRVAFHLQSVLKTH